MDIQKIIREGNLKVARTRLAQEYLNVSVSSDAELIHLVLVKLEDQGLFTSEEDYEAYQLLDILIDAFPPSHPLYSSFLARLKAVGECFRRPASTRHLMFSNLKVEMHDHHQL